GQVFIENALRGAKLRVDGEGSEKLDFTYIDDLVDGICLTIQHPGARNQIFNMTYGSSRPISDLIRIMQPYFPNLEVESVERDQRAAGRGVGLLVAVLVVGWAAHGRVRRAAVAGAGSPEGGGARV